MTGRAELDRDEVRGRGPSANRYSEVMLFRRRDLAEAAELRLHLREAAAWCADIVGDDRDARLWTPGLGDADVAADEDAVWNALTAAPVATVGTVLERRARCLAGRRGSRRLDGRVLVCEYDCSMFDRASRHEAPGFIDIWDIPAWDMWIGLVSPGAVPAGGRDRPSPLLAWIPAPLMPRTRSAIDVNPVEVLSWLDSRNPRLGRALLAER